MIRVAIVGAAGRMGRILLAQVLQDPALSLSAALEHSQHPLLGQDAGLLAGEEACGVVLSSDVELALAESDAAIDFSAPAASLAFAEKAAAAGVSVVIGTTGLNAGQKAELAELAAAGAKLVFAPNMSVGVNLLFSLCAKTAAALGEDYDIEVVEMHHNQKKDAPSGTAERLGEVLAKARGLDYEQDARHGRVGMPGARSKNEIGMHALRGGDVVGDHTVIFATKGERIELTHKASGRETFAKGALRAVKFLAKAEPGLYDMQQVLGL
ncbi:MAG: 4-hydroxy-tetrahydrodipicolinate reductase [Oligosphaeraceae bacterium]|nr:4-hydroxy-tetrahydrodipicolinate reductase [Oligosphaeraceae bacterium]